MRVGDRQRVLPARPRPRARRLGPPPGGGRARRRRRRARARAAPPRARRARPRLRDAPGALRTLAAQPRHVALDGIDVRYVPFLAPPRPRSYGSWGAWAAPTLAVALRRLRARVPLRPRARPQRRARRRRRAARAHPTRRSSSPCTAATSTTPRPRHPAGARAVRRAFGSARLVLANSAGHRGARRAARRRAHARRAPGHRRPRPPAAQAPRARPWSPSATSSRASATPTCCARCGCCASATRELRYLVIGDGPERAPLERLAAELGRRRPRRVHGPAAARGGAGRAPRARPRVRHAQRRRGLRRRLRRGDGRRAARDRRRAARPGPAGDRGAGDGHASSSPPADVEALAARARRAARRAAYRAASSARARATTVAARASPGRPAGARRSPPTRTRCDDGPSCSSPTTSPPDRAGAFRALHERVPLELALFGGRSHHATAGRRRPRRAATAASASARSTRWPLGGRYRAVVCGTAGRVALPGRLPRRAARARAVRALERAVGRPEHARAPAPRARCCAASTAAPPSSSPTARTSARTSGALGARARRRRPAGGRQRVLVGAGRRATRRAAVHGAVRRARRPEKGLAVLREAWRARGGSPTRAPRGASAPDARRRRPSRSATPTPARTFWSYRRSPPATSASRGGSSPTKP